MHYKEHELTSYLQDSPARNENANSNDDITQYYITMIKSINACRSRDVNKTFEVYTLSKLSFHTHYVCATITIADKTYLSYYIRQIYRGQGIFRSLLIQAKEADEVILTTSSCRISAILKSAKVKHKIVKSLYDSLELATAFDFMQKTYASERANRSNVLKINHIIEGIMILNYLRIDDKHVEASYCLHPVFQDANIEMTNNLNNYLQHRAETKISYADLLHSFAYSKVANALLLNDFEEGKIVANDLYTNDVVKKMLIADKIQNFKDFETYHSTTHPKANSLTSYFEYWLESLSISKATYEEVVKHLESMINVELNLEDLT